MFWLWRKDSNLRMAALTVRCLTNLATPQKEDGEIGRNGDGEISRNGLPVAPSPFSPSPCFFLEAMKGVEPLSTGLQDRRSVIQLSYIAINLVDWEGVKPSQEVCRTSMLSITSPARDIYHLSLDIFQLPSIRLHAALVGPDDSATRFENNHLTNLK